MKKRIPKKSAHIISTLQGFQVDLLKIYGEDLQGVILFGSYARGDFRDGSDIDLMLLFDENYNSTAKDDEIYDKIAAMIIETKYVISLIPTSIQLFETKRTPLYLNVKKEGIEIWKK